MENTQVQMKKTSQEEKRVLLTADDYEWVSRKRENYDTVKRFVPNKKNRILKDSALQTKLNQLLDKENHKWGQLDPIQVNLLTGNMTDGHARTLLFMQCIEDGSIPKDTTIPVEYIKLDPKLERTYLRQKQNGRSWTGDDFISSEINDGNKNYLSIERFCTEHELCHTKNKEGKISKMRYRRAAAMLYGVRKGVPLRDGEFIFPEDKVIDANIIHDELLKIIELIGETPSNIESMTTAWCKVRELADFKTEWCKVLRLKKYKGGPQTTKSLNETIWVGYFKMALGDILEYRSKK